MLTFLIYKSLLPLLVGELKTVFCPPHCSQNQVVSIVSEEKKITSNVFLLLTLFYLKEQDILLFDKNC